MHVNVYGNFVDSSELPCTQPSAYCISQFNVFFYSMKTSEAHSDKEIKYIKNAKALIDKHITPEALRVLPT